jgi:hypothetical protein
MRTRNESEQRRIRSSNEPERSGFLHVRPPDRELRNARDLVVDDGAISHGRAHETIPVCAQHFEQGVEVIASDHEKRAC